MAKPDLPEGSAYYPPSVVAKKQMLSFEAAPVCYRRLIPLAPFFCLMFIMRSNHCLLEDGKHLV